MNVLNKLKKNYLLLIGIVFILFIGYRVYESNQCDKAFLQAQKFLSEHNYKDAKTSLQKAKRYTIEKETEFDKMINSIDNYQNALQYIKAKQLDKAINCLGCVSYQSESKILYEEAQKKLKEVKENYKCEVNTKADELRRQGKSDEASALIHDAQKLLGIDNNSSYSIEDSQQSTTPSEEDSEINTSSQAQQQEPSKPQNLTSLDGNLELIKYGCEDHYITGIIKNNSDTMYNYVEVNITLYDKDGNQVGNALSNIENLEGYKSWNFKAVVIEDNVASYKVTSIEAM